MNKLRFSVGSLLLATTVTAFGVGGYQVHKKFNAQADKIEQLENDLEAAKDIISKRNFAYLEAQALDLKLNSVSVNADGKILDAFGKPSSEGFYLGGAFKEASFVVPYNIPEAELQKAEASGLPRDDWAFRYNNETRTFEFYPHLSQYMNAGHSAPHPSPES